MVWYASASVDQLFYCSPLPLSLDTALLDCHSFLQPWDDDFPPDILYLYSSALRVFIVQGAETNDSQFSHP
jgi:hypothetical protein